MLRNVYVTKRVTFEACHYLPNYEGKCANLHGHSYKVEVTFKGQVFSPEDVSETTPSALAMVHDFTDIKKLLNRTVVDRFDHKNLNDFLVIPTAEGLAVDIYDRIREELENKADYEIVKVRVWETEDSYATYNPSGGYYD